VDDFIDAVNAAPEFDINLPLSIEEWLSINEEWKKKSTNEIIAGCVGALDGFFRRTNKPTKKEVSNQISYYSGHYESFGLNCQALVSSDLQFLYFGVVSPSSTNDNISHSSCVELKDVIDSLSLGLYTVADAAYTLTEKLLIPFIGVDHADPAKDSCNYSLSQIRICVEIAFGRLVNMFCILSGKIEGRHYRVSAILIA
jgi:hypothetical protein